MWLHPGQRVLSPRKGGGGGERTIKPEPEIRPAGENQGTRTGGTKQYSKCAASSAKKYWIEKTPAAHNDIPTPLRRSRVGE